MVIEWLKFQVSPQLREKFIQQETEIWIPFLSSHPGFLGKEIWINPEAAEEVIIVIRWETHQQWKAIPEDEIAATDRKFAQALGEDNYQLVEAGDYQVRKFSQSN